MQFEYYYCAVLYTQMEALQTFVIQCIVWVREQTQCTFQILQGLLSGAMQLWLNRAVVLKGLRLCKVSDSAEIFLRSRTTGPSQGDSGSSCRSVEIYDWSHLPKHHACPAGSRLVTVRGLMRVILIMQPHSRNGDQMAAFIPWRSFRPQWYLCLSSAQCAPPLAINTTHEEIHSCSFFQLKK